MILLAGTAAVLGLGVRNSYCNHVKYNLKCPVLVFFSSINFLKCSSVLCRQLYISISRPLPWRLPPAASQAWLASSLRGSWWEEDDYDDDGDNSDDDDFFLLL